MNEGNNQNNNMNYCPNCGTNVEGKFCTNCGTEINSLSQPQNVIQNNQMMQSTNNESQTNQNPTMNNVSPNNTQSNLVKLKKEGTVGKCVGKTIISIIGFGILIGIPLLFVSSYLLNSIKPKDIFQYDLNYIHNYKLIYIPFLVISSLLSIFIIFLSVKNSFGKLYLTKDNCKKYIKIISAIIIIYMIVSNIYTFTKYQSSIIEINNKINELKELSSSYNPDYLKSWISTYKLLNIISIICSIVAVPFKILICNKMAKKCNQFAFDENDLNDDLR